MLGLYYSSQGSNNIFSRVVIEILNLSTKRIQTTVSDRNMKIKIDFKLDMKLLDTKEYFLKIKINCNSCNGK